MDALKLDGNAAAGLLQEVFTAEITTARGMCAGCGAVEPVGAVSLYSGAGMVLRCPHCDAVLVKASRAAEERLRRGDVAIARADDGVLVGAVGISTDVLEEGESGRRSFRFIPGPVFCQLLMADEINRASPRTQSALLQSMQEKHVTVAGNRHDLPAPFHVLATQNPLEQEGTYPLPEAQLDRFAVRMTIGYPQQGDEARMLAGRAKGLKFTGAKTVQELVANLKKNPQKVTFASSGAGSSRLRCSTIARTRASTSATRANRCPSPTPAALTGERASSLTTVRWTDGRPSSPARATRPGHR